MYTLVPVSSPLPAVVTRCCSSVFWFFGHPGLHHHSAGLWRGLADYPAFSRKQLFGYDSMVYATASDRVLSFIVWAHHMFTVGMPVAGELFFMYATMLIAVPLV